MKMILIQDNGGRRSGVDRRSFDYAFHIPERRKDQERRSGQDRRKPRHIEKIQQPQSDS